MRTVLLGVLLGVVLVGLIALAVRFWAAFGKVEIAGFGLNVLALVAVVCLALTMGLFALRSNSKRHRHDDEASE